MKNKEIADVLEEIADILEIQNVQWKPRAYHSAALNINALSEDLAVIYKKGGNKALKEIPGVGENIAKKIEELLKTGKLKYLIKLKKQIPEAVEKIMKIQGIGPKKAKLIYDKLKIKNIKDLEKAIKQGKLKKIKGMGEKTSHQIIEGIKTIKASGKRHLLGEMLFIAKDIEARLKKLKQVERVDLAGSLRRMKETIGDVDILVISSKPAIVTKFFTTMPEVKKVLWTGPTKSSIKLDNNLQVDLRILNKQHYGSALQYFTGSKQHSIKLRKIAIKKGYKLSEYGLFKGKKIIASKTQEDIYKKLGLQPPEPELREDRGEIEAALKHRLPKLIQLKDIQGDLHVHTKWSDGNNSLQEMADAAKKLGYRYLGIADHSASLKIARGLDEKRLLKQINEINKLNKKLRNITLLKSAEVDIKKDGSLDMKKDTLKKLDLVTASIHSGFKSSESEMTQRIITAIENPCTNILGHPTGRILFKRNPYQLNLDKVLQAAKDNNTALEINSLPNRLDLNDTNARKAKDFKAKLAINTDAHIADQLRFMELGVGTARRAWLEKSDVINTFPLKKLKKFLT